MRLLKLLFALAICLSFSVVAFAHSGGTDSNGGHTDRDTGEYHYHHGYPAHQHTDMDGDGILDCPYEFKDITDSSGIKGESSKDKTEASKDKTESSSNKTETQEKKEKSGKIKSYLVPIVICFALYAVIWGIDAIKWRIKK